MTQRERYAIADGRGEPDVTLDRADRCALPSARRDSQGGTPSGEDADMPNPSTFLLSWESQPMLFADCPFCLRPLPFDLEAGAMDCPDCAVHLELAPEPEPKVLAPAA
jgi:hypothetical protein